MKYSKSNNRDFEFYFRNRKIFNFCGTAEPSFVPIYDKSGVDGKAAFFSIENKGINIPTKHPNILATLLLSKASVNFNIKMWAQGRADGTLPLIEFSQRKVMEVYPHFEIEYDKNDMENNMGLPKWVIEAVENQKYKYYRIN